MENNKLNLGLSLQRPLAADVAPPDGLKIITRNINAYFGKTQALRNVSLSIPEKRVTAIIGPSGCGKSTYLRCLNRMHEVAHGTMTGEILLDGLSVMEYDPVLLRRRVGI
jgi:phosphate transport system ATP-binding protein